MTNYLNSSLKVSICMIVKNEQANLQRCLDSLAAIINWKDDNTLDPLSELIIVDTGSTDLTVNVAKKYTDKIYHFEWNDSFSDARNFGIEKATGKRILIFDADEELSQDSLYQLMERLYNPAYDKYPAFFFRIRNFYDKQQKRYSDFMQPRCFLNDGFRYEGAVHNKPAARPPYFWCDDIYINHYGYKFDGNTELQDKKKSRSLPMLLKEYKKNQDDIHILAHIVKTYKITDDQENIIKFGEMFVEKFRGVEYHDGWFGYLESFNILLGVYVTRGDEENALRIYNELQKYSSRTIQSHLLIGAMYSGKDEQKEAEYYEKAAAVFESPTEPHEMLLTQNADAVMPQYYNWLAHYYLENGNKKKAGKYLNDGILANNNRLPIRWDIFNIKAVKNAA